MAKSCAICGKTYIKGRSYSWLRANRRNPTGIRRQHPNLQKFNYKGKKVQACAKCIKASMKIKKTKKTRDLRPEIKAANPDRKGRA